MKISGDVSVTLPSKNYDREHGFTLLEREDTVAIIVGNRIVATLRVETMEKEVKDDDGDYHIKPSDDFYIIFEAMEAVAKKSCSALAYVEEKAYCPSCNGPTQLPKDIKVTSTNPS